jgi:outer membrane protein TolC
VGVDYIETNDVAGSKRPSDSGQDAVAVGAAINLPIWRGKYDAGVRQSLANFNASMRDRVNRQNLLAADLKSSVYHYQDALRKVDLFRDTLVPKARQALKATEASFRTGKSTFADLVDAARVLLAFQLAYERALSDGSIRFAEVQMLVGKRDIDSVVQKPDADQAPADQTNKDEPDVR